VLGREVPNEVVQYFVPVPGHDKAVVLTFSTPTVQIDVAFPALFAAIAESLHWIR
jgi:hypothetical protein